MTATSRKTFQYQSSISINRDAFMGNVVLNDDLSKKELRVLLHLLCHLDAKMAKEISIKNIARDLDISKSDVKDAVDALLEMNLIERISSGSVRDGLILTF